LREVKASANHDDGHAECEDAENRDIASKGEEVPETEEALQEDRKEDNQDRAHGENG